MPKQSPIPIPAICPTCQQAFNSPISMGEGATFNNYGSVIIPCPNGHSAYVPQGSYTVVNGLLRIISGGFGSTDDLQLIESVAREATHKSSTEQQSALDQIAALLPSESAAALRQLGANNPLIAILALLLLLGNIANSIRGSAPAAPPPAPVVNNQINNSITVLNSGAAERDEGSANPPSREQLRRLKQLEKIKEKRKTYDENPEARPGRQVTPRS